MADRVIEILFKHNGALNLTLKLCRNIDDTSFDMKLTLIWIIAALFLLSSQAFADEGRIFNGAPIRAETAVFHVQGAPVTAQVIVAELHLMNHTGSQPVGLWEYFYIATNSSSRNASTCARWFNQVRTDEANQSSAGATRAWLQIKTSGHAPAIQTDEGVSLVPDSNINCWESVEFSSN